MRTRNKNREATNNQAAVPAENGFSLISDQKLIDLYAGLLKRRMAEERSHSRKGQAGSLKGHEAGAVGTTIDLAAGDRLVFLDYRNGRDAGYEWIPSPVAAVPLTIMDGHGLNGHASHGGTGSASGSAGAGMMRGAQHSPDAAMHTIVGAALAQRTRRDGKISVVVAQDGTQKPWQDALHIAVTHSLPIVFVQQPDGRSRIGERNKAKTARKKREDAGTPYLPSIVVDSNDVVAIYRVASEAIARARKGRGPTLIECQPFYVEGQAGSSGKARSNGAAAKKLRDPIAGMEDYLRGKGLFSPEIKTGLLAKAAGELGPARQGRKRKGLKTSDGKVGV